ncbi:Hypothetical protein SMAX5B_012322 [Scophthalmus maximus]|uniref:Uncharacterized protein n=1 Tax=Scophthalmus maximus TaxID=52904 RepID=A0A2U9B759_SCOMX|nr:Hypothetical protein SMAX5B_012322 [Scophthalmus maximus]
MQELRRIDEQRKEETSEPWSPGAARHRNDDAKEGCVDMPEIHVTAIGGKDTECGLEELEIEPSQLVLN